MPLAVAWTLCSLSARPVPVLHNVLTFCSLTETLTVRSSAVYCEVRPQGVLYTDSDLQWPCHGVRFVTFRLGFRLGSVHVGFVVDKVAGIGAGFCPSTLVFSYVSFRQYSFLQLLLTVGQMENPGTLQQLQYCCIKLVTLMDKLLSFFDL